PSCPSSPPPPASPPRRSSDLAAGTGRGAAGATQAGRARRADQRPGPGRYQGGPQDHRGTARQGHDGAGVVPPAVRGRGHLHARDRAQQGHRGGAGRAQRAAGSRQPDARGGHAGRHPGGRGAARQPHSGPAGAGRDPGRPGDHACAAGDRNAGASRGVGVRGAPEAHRPGGPVRPADRDAVRRPAHRSAPERRRPRGGGVMTAIAWDETPEVTDRRHRAPLSRLVLAEVRWIFRRPRTLVVLALLAIFPPIIGISIVLAGPGEASGEAPLFVAAATSALSIPLGSFMMLMSLFLPLAVAMAGADAIAGEQSVGALRGWLVAPVSRGRLLAVKVFGVLAVALVAAGLVALTGLTTGLILNGMDGIITLSGTTLGFADALGRIGLAVAWVTLQLLAVGAVALAIS